MRRLFAYILISMGCLLTSISYADVRISNLQDADFGQVTKISPNDILLTYPVCIYSDTGFYRIRINYDDNSSAPDPSLVPLDSTTTTATVPVRVFWRGNFGVRSQLQNNVDVPAPFSFITNQTTDDNPGCQSATLELELDGATIADAQTLAGEYLKSLNITVIRTNGLFQL